MSAPRSLIRRGAALAGILAVAAPAAAQTQTPRLTQFPTCSSLRQYAAAKAAPLVRSGGYGAYPVALRSARPMFDLVRPMVGAQGGGVVPSAAPAGELRAAIPQPGAGGAQPPTSGTNLQEPGVDEPDMVLSDPAHVITTVNDELRIHSVADTPVLIGRLRLPGAGTGAQMIRSGDRIMVFSSRYALPVGVNRAARDMRFAPWAPQTMIRLVDIADPTTPVLLETLTVDGDLLAARRPEGGAVRVVLSTSPDPIPFVDSATPGVAGAAQARRINVRRVRNAPARTWLPAMRIRIRGTARATTRIAVDCRSVARTTQFGGLGTLTVLTIDPATGLTPVDRDAILSDGQIVYASPTSLYVTTPRWMNPAVMNPDAVPDNASTEVHRFDISAPNATEYRSSGRVPGYILNQFSLSEWRGVLRVASTRDPEWINQKLTTRSESFVTTLRDDGVALTRLGQVGKLGTDERIYGVRFIDDRGYVVTFRQIDPLHVLDLSDPATPRVTGELKIPGYSAYLHPVGDGLLLGVGQDADPQGRLRGTQVSLFDVSNPAAPARLQNLTLPDSWSEAENDHHAFLHWAPTGLTMVPFIRYSPAGVDSGALGLTVSRVAGITRLGIVRHRVEGRSEPGTIRRSLVIGDRVFTVSDVGIAAGRLTDLNPLGFTAFPVRPTPPSLMVTPATSPK